MTCICEHVKGEHLLTGQCYQCECPRYQLDVNADREKLKMKAGQIIIDRDRKKSNITDIVNFMYSNVKKKIEVVLKEVRN